MKDRKPASAEAAADGRTDNAHSRSAPRSRLGPCARRRATTHSAVLYGRRQFLHRIKPRTHPVASDPRRRGAGQTERRDWAVPGEAALAPTSAELACLHRKGGRCYARPDRLSETETSNSIPSEQAVATQVRTLAGPRARALPCSRFRKMRRSESSSIEKMRVRRQFPSRRPCRAESRSASRRHEFRVARGDSCFFTCP